LCSITNATIVLLVLHLQRGWKTIATHQLQVNEMNRTIAQLESRIKYLNKHYGISHRTGRDLSQQGNDTVAEQQIVAAVNSETQQQLGDVATQQQVPIDDSTSVKPQPQPEQPQPSHTRPIAVRPSQPLARPQANQHQFDIAHHDELQLSQQEAFAAAEADRQKKLQQLEQQLKSLRNSCRHTTEMLEQENQSLVGQVHALQAQEQQLQTKIQEQQQQQQHQQQQPEQQQQSLAAVVHSGSIDLETPPSSCITRGGALHTFGYVDGMCK
jgi:hypothetical protein